MTVKLTLAVNIDGAEVKSELTFADLEGLLSDCRKDNQLGKVAESLALMLVDALAEEGDDAA